MERGHEELYGSLVCQAAPIISRLMQGFDRGTWQEVAHDITVDFLFYSSSYQKVFDKSRDVKPFFAAYVKLCTRRYREKLQKGYYHGELTDDCAVCEDVGSLQFEAQDFAHAMAKCLEDKMFYWQQCSISLHDLFMMSLQSWNEKGKSNLTWIAKQLGYKKPVVEKALLSMREVLRERFEDEPQDFYLTHQRTG